MKRHWLHSLSGKFTLGFLILAVLISITSCTLGYHKYKTTIEKLYNERAYAIARIAQSYVDGDVITSYLTGRPVDDAYREMGKNLDNLLASSKSNYIFISVVDGMKMTYIYDARNANYPQLRLGEVDTYLPEFEEDINHIQKTGELVDNYFIAKSEFGYNTSAVVPILNSNREPVAVLSVDIAMTTIQSTLREYVISTILVTTLLVFIIIFIYLAYLRRKLIRPLKQLTTNAKSFVDNGEGGLQVETLTIQTGDEIEALATALNQMEIDLTQYVSNLAQVTADKERIATELNVATQIQTSMLPCIFPAFPDRPEFDIYAQMTAAKEVGGDFYDFFLIDQTHLGVVMADVSGKGVPAALFMVIAKTLIKNHAQLGLSPAQVFTTVNNQLCESNEAGMFVTAFMGIWEIQTGKFTYVNAGHNPPLIRQQGNAYQWLKTRPGFVLAGMEDMQYQEQETTLQAGDCLFLYTDGVTEALNPQEELYSEERLLHLFQQPTITAGQNAQATVEAVEADVACFAGGAEQADDITMLLLRINQ